MLLASGGDEAKRALLEERLEGFRTSHTAGVGIKYAAFTYCVLVVSASREDEKRFSTGLPP